MLDMDVEPGMTPENDEIENDGECGTDPNADALLL